MTEMTETPAPEKFDKTKFRQAVVETIAGLPFKEPDHATTWARVVRITALTLVYGRAAKASGVPGKITFRTLQALDIFVLVYGGKIYDEAMKLRQERMRAVPPETWKFLRTGEFGDPNG